MLLHLQEPNYILIIKLADWHHEIVDQDITNSVRCISWEKFGHTKKWCRERDEICLCCARKGHQSNIVQLNQDAQIAVELALPITTGVMLSSLVVKLMQPLQWSILLAQRQCRVFEIILGKRGNFTVLQSTVVLQLRKREEQKSKSR